jgi:acyl carrier protein
VATSLRIEPELITEDAYLNDLGAESLDLLEITMEAEDAFNILIPQKTILQTAQEVFGEGVLTHEGRLTEAGRKFLAARTPDVLRECGDDVNVATLNRLFLRVGTWIQMIRRLVEATPRECPQCGTAFGKAVAGRLKCASCGTERDIPSGDDLNRQWVEEYYRAEYGAAQSGAQSAPAPAPAV